MALQTDLLVLVRESVGEGQHSPVAWVGLDFVSWENIEK